jgi:hypothetical protein
VHIVISPDDVRAQRAEFALTHQAVAP